MKREWEILQMVCDCLALQSMRETLLPNDPARIVEVGWGSKDEAVTVMTEDRVHYRITIIPSNHRSPSLTPRARSLLELVGKTVTERGVGRLLAEDDPIEVLQAEYEPHERAVKISLLDGTEYKLVAEEINN